MHLNLIGNFPDLIVMLLKPGQIVATNDVYIIVSWIYSEDVILNDYWKL